MEQADRDLLIRMDTKLDIFIRRQAELEENLRRVAVELEESQRRMSDRFEIEREKIWRDIDEIKSLAATDKGFKKGAMWAIGALGVMAGAAPGAAVMVAGVI